MSASSPPSLIVTTSWDDGSVFDLKIAELLAKYGVRGTFYVPKSLFAHPLSPGDIREIDKHLEVGSHTLHHVDLTRVPPERAEAEIVGSRAYLEDLLGHPVAMLSYPDGKHSRGVAEMVRRAGFVAARTCVSCGFQTPRDRYRWGVTMLACDGSPLLAARGWLKSPFPLRGLRDWEARARYLWDRALKAGGVYHIYGHAMNLELDNHWDRLERVLAYISGRQGVRYLTNGELFASPGGGAAHRP